MRACVRESAEACAKAITVLQQYSITVVVHYACAC